MDNSNEFITDQEIEEMTRDERAQQAIEVFKEFSHNVGLYLLIINEGDECESDQPHYICMADALDGIQNACAGYRTAISRLIGLEVSAAHMEKAMEMFLDQQIQEEERRRKIQEN